MSLSAEELHLHIAALKPRLEKHHIGHPLLYATNCLFFHLSGESHRFVLALDDADPRFYLADEALDVSSLDSKFLDQLKRDLNNAYVIALDQLNDDRVVAFALTIINSVYKEEARTLYFELIPHHANLILCDAEDRVIAAYRPGEMSDERPLLKGLRYLPPAKTPFPEKVPHYDALAYEKECLTKEKLLEEKRKKDRFGWLFQSLRKKEKLLERKLTYIEQDEIEAKKHLSDGAKADAIYVHYSELHNRMGSFRADGVEITLDPSRSLSANAELYYKRAKKAKETLAKGEENRKSTEKELADTQAALVQLSAASEAGLELLAKELDLRPQAPSNKKKVKEWRGLSRDSLPYFIDYHGTKILFGKSSKQNDCLSFLFDTSKEHPWLHVMGNSGSHVMIKKENASPDEILAAAEIALLSSDMAEGEVMLTLRGNVRKGSVSGQAIVKEFKTLRLSSIRPDTRNLFQSARKVELE